MVGQYVVVFALLAADVVRESVFVTSTLVDTSIKLDGEMIFAQIYFEMITIT